MRKNMQYQLYLAENKDQPVFVDHNSKRVIQQAIMVEQSTGIQCEVFQFLWNKDNIVDVEQIY